MWPWHENYILLFFFFFRLFPPFCFPTIPLASHIQVVSIIFFYNVLAEKKVCLETCLAALFCSSMISVCVFIPIWFCFSLAISSPCALCSILRVWIGRLALSKQKIVFIGDGIGEASSFSSATNAFTIATEQHSVKTIYPKRKWEGRRRSSLYSIQLDLLLAHSY